LELFQTATSTTHLPDQLKSTQLKEGNKGQK